MKFQITFLTVLALGVAANPIAEPLEGAVEDKKLNARACACASGTPQGQYCGYCPQVTSGWVWNHVYECNPRGGCHDYGVRTSCSNYQGPGC